MGGNTLKLMDKLSRWHWERLPEEEHSEVIEAVENQDFYKLLILHNKYKLSDYTYCCSSDNGFINHFRNAITRGIIK